MAKNVILEDGEIEILLSYHKERLANVTAELETLHASKETSERRLQELTGVHEQAEEASAAEPVAEHEETAEAVAEAEPESLHLTDDGVVLAEEHATETVAEDDEETVETEHEPNVESIAEEEAETSHASVEAAGVHHIEDETVEAAELHIAEPVAEHEQAEEPAREVSLNMTKLKMKHMNQLLNMPLKMQL